VNIFFRVLLAIYAFCLALASAAVMLMTINTGTYDVVSAYLSEHVFTGGATALRIVVFLIALAFFVLSMMFLMSGIKSNKDKKAVSKHTNMGEIRISLNSVENVATNASKKAGGIRETKTTVKRADEGVQIVVRLVVMPDLSIPAISEDVQGRVKRAVEESCGIAVNDVKVVVDSIYSGATYKARVE
jgi:uncharacterized alkaline shock family protein YloU